MTASKTDELNKNAEIAYNLKRIRAERGVSEAAGLRRFLIF